MKVLDRLRTLGDLFRLILRRGFSALRTPSKGVAHPPQRLLILGYGAVGDFVFFLPVLQRLRQAFPDAHLSFAANAYPTTQELLPALRLVDEILIIENTTRAQPSLRALAQRIRTNAFDAVIVSQATPFRLFAPLLLDIPLRIGHCWPLEAPHRHWSWARYSLWRLRRGVGMDEFYRRLVLNARIWMRDDNEHTVSRNLRLLEPLGLAAPPAAEARPSFSIPPPCETQADALIRNLTGKTIVGLHIGSPHSQYRKVWPPERWAEVCQRIIGKDVEVVLLGGQQEQRSAEIFRSHYGRPVLDLTGRCDLWTTAAVIRRCALLMSSDTGLSKIAMALRTPTATVWGPSDRPGWGAIWDRDQHLEIFRAMECAPCVGMGWVREGDGVINFMTCGHHACLAELSPETVAAAILRKHPLLKAV